MEGFNWNEDKKEEVKKEKFGFAIGIISDGNVPFTWMLHHMNIQKSLPSGIHWSYVYAIADFKRNPQANYATSRTEVVKAAQKMGVKWLFFNDTDVFIPLEAIRTLMSYNKPIVTGIYFLKRTNVLEPVVYSEVGQGPMWDIKVGDGLKEIGGAGLGCTLIDMDVFDKFDEAGIPYFKQDWEGENFMGKKMTVQLGEDHWFFTQARKLGYKVYCDPAIVCDHWCDITKQFYPLPELRDRYMNNK